MGPIRKGYVAAARPGCGLWGAKLARVHVVAAVGRAGSMAPPVPPMVEVLRDLLLLTTAVQPRRLFQGTTSNILWEWGFIEVIVGSTLPNGGNTPRRGPWIVCLGGLHGPRGALGGGRCLRGSLLYFGSAIS